MLAFSYDSHRRQIYFGVIFYIIKLILPRFFYAIL